MRACAPADRWGVGASAFGLRYCDARTVGPSVLGGPLCQALGDDLRRFERRFVQLRVFGERALDPLALIHQMIAHVVQLSDELLDFQQRRAGNALCQQSEVICVSVARLGTRVGNVLPAMGFLIYAGYRLPRSDLASRALSRAPAQPRPAAACRAPAPNNKLTV